MGCAGSACSEAPGPHGTADSGAREDDANARSDAANADAQEPDAGEPDLGIADAGPPTECILPAPSAQPECQNCQAEHCCRVASECDANPDCALLIGCIAACADQACVTACRQSHAAATWYFSGVVLC